MTQTGKQSSMLTTVLMTKAGKSMLDIGDKVTTGEVVGKNAKVFLQGQPVGVFTSFGPEKSGKSMLLTPEQIASIKVTEHAPFGAPSDVLKMKATAVIDYPDLLVKKPLVPHAEIDGEVKKAVADFQKAISGPIGAAPAKPIFDPFSFSYDGPPGTKQLTFKDDERYVLVVPHTPALKSSTLNAFAKQLHEKGITACVVAAPAALCAAWKLSPPVSDEHFASLHSGKEPLLFQCPHCSLYGDADHMVAYRTLTKEHGSSTQCCVTCWCMISGLAGNERLCFTCEKFYVDCEGAAPHEHLCAKKWKCSHCGVSFATMPSSPPKVYGQKPLCADCYKLNPHAELEQKQTLLGKLKVVMHFDTDKGEYVEAPKTPIYYETVDDYGQKSTLFSAGTEGGPPPKHLAPITKVPVNPPGMGVGEPPPKQTSMLALLEALLTKK